MKPLLFFRIAASSAFRGFPPVFALCLAMLPWSGRGDELTWQNTGTGDWTVAGNWSGDAAPTASDSALVDNGGSALLGTGESGTSGILTLGASGTGTLEIDGGYLNVSGGISTGANATGSGSLIITGGGELATSGISLGAGTGSISIDSGTLQALSSGTDFLSGYQSGQVTIGAGGATVDTNGNTVAINASLSGTGGLTVTGSGVLTLSTANDYAGGTVVQQGSTLLIGDSSSLGAGNLTVNGGTIGTSGTDTFVATANDVTVNSDFAIDVTGTAAALEIFGNVNLGSAATRTITLTSNGLACFGGTISGQGLTLLSTGTSQAMFCSNSENTFTGTLTVGSGVQLELQKVTDAVAVPGDLNIQAGGSVILEGFNQLAATSNVEVDGQLSENGSGTTAFNSLSGTGSIAGTGFGSTPDTIAVNSGSFAGSISEFDAGGQALIMQGTGLLVLSGSNSYTGGTAITSGTLLAENNYALGGGSISVTNAGVLAVGANLALNTGGNAVTLQANGTATYAKNFASSEAYSHANVVTSSGPAPATAQMLSGSASAATTVSITANSASPAQNDSSRLSDVIILEGTGSDAFVFQLSMTGTNSAAELGWLDGTENWSNAVSGNTGNNATADMLDYQGSFANFELTFSSTLSSYIGAWGIDTSSGTTTAVWAVVNHDGDFAVISPVPEPSAGVLAIFGGIVFLMLTGPRIIKRRFN